MTTIVIDASNLILGRLCSYAAKQALLGNSIDIVNCEECIIKGSRESILQNYHEKFSRGTHAKGPVLYRKPNFFVKRTIRGMMPYKRGRGRTGIKSVKCYIGFPEGLKSHELKKLDEINVLKQGSSKVGYMKLKDLCIQVGWKPRM